MLQTLPLSLRRWSLYSLEPLVKVIGDILTTGKISDPTYCCITLRTSFETISSVRAWWRSWGSFCLPGRTCRWWPAGSPRLGRRWCPGGQETGAVRAAGRRTTRYSCWGPLTGHCQLAGLVWSGSSPLLCFYWQNLLDISAGAVRAASFTFISPSRHLRLNLLPYNKWKTSWKLCLFLEFLSITFCLPKPVLLYREIATISPLITDNSARVCSTQVTPLRAAPTLYQSVYFELCRQNTLSSFIVNKVKIK